jgi:hypothetical protein
MDRAGRFLWLDWAQSKVLENKKDLICAEHDGYRNLQAVHRRTLKRISSSKWEIIDLVFASTRQERLFSIDVHWLLPDWPHKISGNTCALNAPIGSIKLEISSDIKSKSPGLSLYRSGKSLSNDVGHEPLLGWYSPTYGIKVPALSLRFSLKHELPVTITSRFIFS